MFLLIIVTYLVGLGSGAYVSEPYRALKPNKWACDLINTSNTENGFGCYDQCLDLVKTKQTVEIENACAIVLHGAEY